MEGSLYQEVCKVENLFSAWCKVREKDSAGGVDRVTIDDFAAHLEQNLEALAEELRLYRYIPEPYYEVKIPKGEGEFRSLSLPTVRDKIVQQVVKDLIEPILEREFLDVSYAYRERKGPLKAINRVTHLIENEKRGWVTICDIDDYFDSVDHDLLFHMLSERIKDEKLLVLIRLWVKMGKVDRRLRWRDAARGIPQGSIISPLLANLYLHPFDRMMVERRFGYVRYADDFVVLSYSEGEAYRAFEEAKRFLRQRLKLKLNPEGGVRRVQDGFEFLGVMFLASGKTISDEKRAELKNKISDAIDFRKDRDLRGLIETLDGIGNYYGRILSQAVLEELDEWVTGCLKRHLSEAYRDGLFEKKSEIREILSRVGFLSQKYRLFRQRVTRDIVAYCRRKTNGPAKVPVPRPSEKDLIKRKKREYQKLESGGFELVISTPGVFVGKTKRSISVKERGIKKYEVPLLNLKNISILCSGVAISSNVIAYCAEHGVPVDFYGAGGEPYAKVYPLRFPSASLGIAQLEALKNGKGVVLAKSFVLGKIRNQINLVKYYSKYRRDKDVDFTEVLDDKLSMMESLAKRVSSLQGQDVEALRGELFALEGLASSCYWELVKRMLNDYVDFEGRVRHGATDLVNVLLNYGYGILYSRVWEAAIKAGLNVYISYLHKPQEGKPTLVFDLVEEFRQQAVDRAVYALITKGETLEVERGLLSDETKGKVARKVLERINTVEVFRGREKRLFQIMEEQARTVAEFLEGKTHSYRPYVGKW